MILMLELSIMSIKSTVYTHVLAEKFSQISVAKAGGSAYSRGSEILVKILSPPSASQHDSY